MLLNKDYYATMVMIILMTVDEVKCNGINDIF